MRRILLLIGLALTAWSGEPPMVLAHYMPWFAGKQANGTWGWHWTMGKRDPARLSGDGRVDLASHYQPQIGLYDGADPQVLECQLLQMRLAGIDGVIIDWYGISTFRDYGMVQRNTQALITAVRAAGMRYAVCYEDQTVKHRIAGGDIPADQALAQGRRDLDWLARNCLGEPAYVRMDGRPILLVFGPQHFDAVGWSALLTPLQPQPRLFTLPHLATKAGSEAIFGWPPMHGGKSVQPEDLKKHYAELGRRKTQGEGVIPTAFPRFHDFYQEAGLHPSYGSIADRDGATLRETLAMAAALGTGIVQIATWNDYGEGTVIEPTVELGYRDLLIVADSLRLLGRQPAAKTTDDLALPARLLRARRDATTAPARLDQAAAALNRGDLATARRLLPR